MKSKAFLVIPAVIILFLLGCKKTPIEPQVHHPYIRGISATPSNVSRGGATTLECFATDPDQNTLSYIWTSQVGKFYTDTTFSTETDTGNPIVWRAPDSTDVFVINIRVEDGTDGSADSSIAIPVGGYKLLEVLGTGVLTEPMGVFVDGSDNVWVADAGDQYVWKWDGSSWSDTFSYRGVIDTSIDTTYTIDTTKVPPETTDVSIDTTADTLGFEMPIDVYMDGGMIYVLDTGINRVHRFLSPSVAGYDTSFMSISQTDGIPPTGFVVVGDYIYAACGTWGIRKAHLLSDARVRASDPKGARDIAFDGVDRLWVTVDKDVETRYIKSYDLDLNLVTTIQDSVYRPWGIAIGPSGNIFVSQLGDTATADCHMAEFTSTGSFVGKWGDTGSGSEQFNSPAGLWVTSDRKIYVCDRGNGVVKVFGP